MLLNAFPIDVESGETRVSVVTPPCYFMKLIQILPTDAAQVAIRFQAPPSAAMPNQGWIVIRAGELVPMPYNQSVIGTAAKVPAAPQRIEVSVLYGPLDPLVGLGSQRFVFAYLERADASDDPQGGDLKLQVFRTPEKSGASMPINLPADFSTKDLILAPARGATVGDLKIRDDQIPNSGQAGTFYTITEMKADVDGTLFKLRSPVPLGFIIPSPSFTQVSFGLSGLQDYVRVRVWRALDGVARGVETGGYLTIGYGESTRVRMYARSYSTGFTLAAGAAGWHFLAPVNQTNRRDYEYFIRNTGGFTFNVYFKTARNMGLATDEDCAFFLTALGPVIVVAGAIAQAAATGTTDCTIVRVDAVGGGQADGYLLCRSME